MKGSSVFEWIVGKLPGASSVVSIAGSEVVNHNSRRAYIPSENCTAARCEICMGLFQIPSWGPAVWLLKYEYYFHSSIEVIMARIEPTLLQHI